MVESRTLDEIPLEELEVIVAERRHAERARRDDANSRFTPARIHSSDMSIRRPRRERRSAGWRDRLLLFVEVAAVVALVAVSLTVFGNLQVLNQDVAQALAGNSSASSQPSSLKELPGSSFPPSSGLTELPGSSFPPEPVPPALGLRLQRVAALPVPTPGPRSPSRIVISAINVDWPVVQGDGWEELKQGIGHHIGSANPGERGNLILSGHNDVYGEPFRDLEKLEAGSEIIVHAGASSYRYVVRGKRIVVPTDLSVLAPSRSPIITLITCHPYRVNTHRLIVIGELRP